MSPTCSNRSSTVWPCNTCGHVPAGRTTKLWRKSPLQSSAITSALWPSMPPANRSNATPAHCFTKRGDTLPCLKRTLGRWLLQGLDALGNFAFLGNELIKNLADIEPKRSCPQKMHPRSPVFRRLQKAVMTLSCGVWSSGAGVAPGHPARSRPGTKSSSLSDLESGKPANFTMRNEEARFRRFSCLFDGLPLVFPYCGRNLAMRFKFHARQASGHSPVTFFNPRSENWRKPMTDLIMLKTGSTVCLRKA